MRTQGRFDAYKLHCHNKVTRRKKKNKCTFEINHLHAPLKAIKERMDSNKTNCFVLLLV